MDYKEPLRLALTASLLYSAWVVYKCPCETLVACRQNEFYVATLIPVAAVFYMNAKV